MDSFERENLRIHYRPEKIKWLLVAEAPPLDDHDRFFYRKKVDKFDTLYLETMHVLYFEENERKTGRLRNEKPYFLKNFQDDGFYLIDALTEPIKDKRRKVSILRKGSKSAIKRIEDIAGKDTKVILISRPVFIVLHKPLIEKKVVVINKGVIPFPIGCNDIFRVELRTVLLENGWRKTIHPDNSEPNHNASK